MAWTKLPTDYQDAVWNGNRKYRMITNSDGTVSFEDVTEYSQKEYSFFGADEANAMNAGMNELAENMETVATNAQLAKTSADTATTKATEAANSATAAANSQTEAANSASIATSKATEAANSQTEAANSATEAATSATEAQNSADVAKTLLYAGAGAHNAVYRGKNLGTAVTDEQYAAISAGTFDNLYIGDYWTINDVNWRIAAFDYYLNCGDTPDAFTTEHHVVLVPDTCLYNHVMNDTNITTHAYVGSKMYTQGLNQAKTTIKAAFNGHVLSHRVFLSNAVSGGKVSNGAWVSSEVDLMSEPMVYGNGAFSPVSDGSTVPSNYSVEKSQLPLFLYEPSRISNGESWWLRDVISALEFAYVNLGGRSGFTPARGSLGVRPAFCIS